MALSDNLAAGYQLAEASGNALDVLSSNDLTGTNSPGSGTGKLGNCRTFNGSNQYFSKADNATLSTGDIDFSVMGWVNASSLGSYPVIANKGWSGTPGANSEWVLYNEGNGASFRFVLEVRGSGGGIVTATNFGSITTGTWYFIAAGHSASANEIWISVNAGTANTSSHSTGVNDGNGNFVVGASVSQGLYWNGSIDDFYFFKRDIRTDLSSFYNGGSGLDYSSWGGGGGGGVVIPVFMHHYRQQRVA